MSIWAEMHRRSNGLSVRQEDIHKASLLIKKMGAAEKLSGFYTKDDILFNLNHDQQMSFRWHKCDLALVDERFKRRAWFRFGVLSNLGDTGERIVQDAINKVEKEYGFFDGYTCDEEKTDMHKYVSEKNKKMIDEIRDILDRHGMVLLGWRYLIRYRRAISAELIQDLYYDSDSPEGKGLRVLRPYGVNKEEEIGLYKVTYEVFKKRQDEEAVIRALEDKQFYAAIGTDVVATWQKVNDEHVRVNGNWNSFVKPYGAPHGEADIYTYNHHDIQEEKYWKVREDYFNTLCKEHRCKIGEFEDEKLSAKYWDAFISFLNQKDMDIFKTGSVMIKYLYRVGVGIDGFNYDCKTFPGHKNPDYKCCIAVSIYLHDVDKIDRNIARFDFIEEKCKTQIDSLNCKEVRWRKDKPFSYIEVFLEANFRDKADWPRQMEWMYNTLMKLHRIVKPYYGDIRRIK